MFRQNYRRLFFLVILVILATPQVLAQTPSTIVVFSEDFNDGELYNNPTWTIEFGHPVGSAIIGGKYHADGLIVDQSGRYATRMHTLVQIQAPDYLEISLTGLLKSAGNPQEGRAIYLTLLNSSGYGYTMAINRGFVGGWPTDHLTLQLAYPTTVEPIIDSPYLTERDVEYALKAVRQGGVWTLYVNGTSIGSASDSLHIGELNYLVFGTHGSVWVDDIVIKVPSSNEPPDCSTAASSPNSQWPPDHQLANINITGVTDPDGDPINITVDSIFQDEPTNGTGDGDVAPDGFGIGSPTASVRAERSGNGNGRVYHIGYTATDPAGASCSGEVLVKVNHSKKNEAIDDGPIYDSTQ